MRSAFPFACLLLGLGVGGFIDGIVLHQLLEWHHMLSGWYPADMQANMVADGLFHLLCLIFVMTGIALLVHAAPQAPADRGRRAFGWMLAGWGWFNLVEGTVDHLVLGVHHVRAGAGQLAYDLAFLAVGAGFVAIGTLLGRHRAKAPG
ncbi:DUF2243 domain-containing protein [Kibdelosporangium aridum]|uniref:Uncharacterized membrane protein n=1 Tax=Kibdelosporangium aridum TaxID=2030 RepID=A0A1W2FV18_KIBAR|nr:DUF2243 domain-containing protein [Kibdelosporangium aridum]SMD25817.1 Uncharacterized membrane protein [Kibdelosporangium aridum]